MEKLIQLTLSGVANGAIFALVALGFVLIYKSSDVINFAQGELLHLQETFSDVVKTDKTGLSKTAHTRWMISAFANFLPGSTIFRLA